MAEALKIEIVSPEKLVLSEAASSVTVPGSDGYFTVMGEHAPLMSVLKPGFVTVNSDGGASHTFYVRGGFADVSPAGLTILAEDARTAADFSRSEIDAAITAAQEALNAASELEAKAEAQALLDGWKNLLLDAAQAEGATAH